MNSNTIFILDQYPDQEFHSLEEMIKFLTRIGKDRDRFFYIVYEYSTGIFNRKEIIPNKIHSCTMIDKVPLYDGTLYYSEDRLKLTKDITELIEHGYHNIVAFNPNVDISISKPYFDGTNKEAALYLSRYARYRYLHIYENNVIEVFDIDGLGFEIDYNFIFGEAFNIHDRVKYIEYDDELKISFYTVFGIEDGKYSRDAILNAKFNNTDINLHYVLIDNDEYDITKIFDSTQFKRI